MKRKKCTKCGGNKLLCEFHKDKQHRSGYTAYCRECRSNDPKTRAYTKSRYGASIKCRFGITLEEYDRLFDQQGGICAICNQPELQQRLSIDHDHNTGKVRGLLCKRCNLILGILEKLDFNVGAFKKYLKG